MKTVKCFHDEVQGKHRLLVVVDDVTVEDKEKIASFFGISVNEIPGIVHKAMDTMPNEEQVVKDVVPDYVFPANEQDLYKIMQVPDDMSVEEWKGVYATPNVLETIQRMTALMKYHKMTDNLRRALSGTIRGLLKSDSLWINPKDSLIALRIVYHSCKPEKYKKVDVRTLIEKFDTIDNKEQCEIVRGVLNNLYAMLQQKAA